MFLASVLHSQLWEKAARTAHSLPVGVVEAAEPHAFDLLVALAAGVAVAVVAEDEASGAAGGDGEAADAALKDDTFEERVSEETGENTTSS